MSTSKFEQNEPSVIEPNMIIQQLRDGLRGCEKLSGIPSYNKLRNEISTQIREATFSLRGALISAHLHGESIQKYISQPNNALKIETVAKWIYGPQAIEENRTIALKNYKAALGKLKPPNKKSLTWTARKHILLGVFCFLLSGSIKLFLLSYRDTHPSSKQMSRRAVAYQSRAHLQRYNKSYRLIMFVALFVGVVCLVVFLYSNTSKSPSYRESYKKPPFEHDESKKKFQEVERSLGLLVQTLEELQVPLKTYVEKVKNVEAQGKKEFQESRKLTSIDSFMNECAKMESFETIVYYTQQLSEDISKLHIW